MKLSKSSPGDERPQLERDRVLGETLFIPELCQPDGLAPTKDLLHLLQHVQSRRGVEIVSPPLGHGGLDHTAVKTQQAAHVPGEPQRELPALAHQPALAACEIPGRFGDIAGGGLHARVAETGSQPVPVARDARGRWRLLRIDFL